MTPADMPDVHPTFGLPLEHCPAFFVRRASRAISQLYDRAFADAGIRSTQYSLMLAISLFGDRGLSQLAQGMATDRTTLSRTVDGLIRRNWVEELPSEDHRLRPLRLTEEGETKFKEAYALWSQVHERVTNELGAETVEQVIRLSDRILGMAENVAK